MNRIQNLVSVSPFTEDGKALPTQWLYLLLSLFLGITLFLTFPLAFRVPTGGWIIGLQGGLGILICLSLVFLVRAFKDALRRAQESEQQYRNFLENIPAITYLNSLGDDTPTTYVSPQVKDLIGYSREALLADPQLWFKCVHPDDQPRVQAENERTNHTGEPFMLDYRLKAQTGETVWVHDEAVLLHNEKGEPLHWLGVWTDITDRKQVETALAQERDLLQALMDNIPDMIYFKDRASRFIRINRAHANLLNLKDPAQANGKTDFDLHVPELAQDFYREEQILFRTGRPILDRLEYNPTDHAPRWISATKVPLRSPDGQLIGLVGISRDVTDWEMTRRMLEKRANELATVTRVSSAISTILDVSDLLQTVVNLTQDNFALYHAHIYLLDEEEKNLRVSAGTGETGKVLQTQSWQIPLDHPNSIVAQVARTREGIWYNHVQSTTHFLPNPLLPDTQAELTVPIIATDQLLGVFDLQSEQPERFSDDDILVYTALAQQLAVALQNARRYELAQAEIMERKRAEDALRATEQVFRAAIEAAGAVPYSIQYGAKQYTFMGEGITKLVGYSREEMLPAKWDDLIQEAIMLGTGQGLSRAEASRKVLAGELTIWQADYRILTSTGEPRWLSDASVQIKNDQGKPFGAIGVLQDITERKQVEETLQRLNLDLEKRVEERTTQLAMANQELESFTYTVSHDLRAPVRAMVGFTAILLEEYAYQIPLGAQNYLQHIRSGAERLGQLVDGLLTFIRLGRQELVRHEVNLRLLAQQVFDEMIENQLGRVVTLQLDEIPPQHADPSLCRELFTLLLDNALKYSRREAEAEIHIGMQTTSGTPVYFVKDNGIGFDMQYIHKLFGVFQQLHRPGEYAGTGIGLALARRIVEKHGGRIWAEAAPNQGATFYFTLNN